MRRWTALLLACFLGVSVCLAGSAAEANASYADEEFIYVSSGFAKSGEQTSQMSSEEHGNGGTPPDGTPPGGMNGGPDHKHGTPPDGGMREGDVASTGNAVNTSGIISVSDGIVTADDDLSGCVSQLDDCILISGLKYASGDYETTAITAQGSTLKISGSSVDLTVDDPISGNESAGSGVYASSGTVTIDQSNLHVDGAGRYTVAATGNATMIVRNSVIEAGGDAGADGNTSSVSEPASNAGLLISGTSRANFSVGQTHTFYYDSLCLAEGWAALSTDSATGSGLEFVAVDTEAVALHGGYGIYSDTNCRDYLYGSTLVSAEVGGIISNNGSIVIGSSEDALESETQDGYAVLTHANNGNVPDAGRSQVIAGRNCFQLHSPDMMGEGTSDYTASLTLSHTDLITDSSINAEGYAFLSEVSGESYLVQATTDYTEKYGDAVGAYIHYVNGAAILIKSTSADILLDDVTVQSSSGVALQTALNSDSMSRYLKKDVADGVHVTVKDSEINGDFVHDDYQRDMVITAKATVLNGAVTYKTADEWNALWSAYEEDETCYWAGLDDTVYITDTHDTTLTLTDGSVWNAQGESRLTQLSVSADSAVNGHIAAEQEEHLEDGTTVYYNAIVTAE